MFKEVRVFGTMRITRLVHDPGGDVEQVLRWTIDAVVALPEPFVLDASAAKKWTSVARCFL